MTTVRSMLIPLLAAAAPAAAQQPLVTDRPDFTESAVAVERLQVEGGYTFTSADDADEHTLGELLARVPLASGLELRLELSSYVWSRGSSVDAAGFTDAALGMKAALADGSDRFDPLRPAAALLAGTTLPTGSAVFRQAELQPEAGVALEWALPDRASLGINASYGYPVGGGERYHRLSGSIAYGYEITDRIGSYIEAFGFLPETRGGQDAAYVNGGFTWLLSPDVQLDVRAGYGPGAASRDGFVGLGASHRW